MDVILWKGNTLFYHKVIAALLLGETLRIILGDGI